MVSNSSNFSYCSYVVLLLVSSFFHFSCQFATSAASTIEFLPGFHGPLPFELETGYVGLGETEEDDGQQVFYYFIKSENNPEKDPLMLWLSGGPGCSSFSGLFYEIGPLAFNVDEEYNGSVPSLVLRPQSWTKACSIIFADLPIGTGFSYGKNPAAYRSDMKLAHHAHQFLRKWLIHHSKFLSNQLYIGGDSYSGVTVPAVVQEISDGNEEGLKPWLNLQGYVLGNPLTTRREENYRVQFAHGMGLISDELYLSLQRSCKGEFLDIDPRNKLCLRDLDSLDECLSKIFYDHILEPNFYLERDCILIIGPKPHEALWRRSMNQKLEASLSSHLKVAELINCPNYKYHLGQFWANDDNVREALHVRKGSISKWLRCFKEEYERDILSSFEYHVYLSIKGYRSLIYSGDHDLNFPFTSTQAWIRDLNYSIVDDWRPWLVKGQVGGYTRTYSNKMTFATVKGGGHAAPEYKPDECLAMFTRWISNVSL